MNSGNISVISRKQRKINKIIMKEVKRNMKNQNKHMRKQELQRQINTLRLKKIELEIKTCDIQVDQISARINSQFFSRINVMKMNTIEILITIMDCVIDILEKITGQKRRNH